MPIRRYDIYACVHKALRSHMSHTLVTLGKLDTSDAEEMRAAREGLRELLLFCRTHLEHENEFIHAAMNARKPGAAAASAQDHVEHEHAIVGLEELSTRLGEATAPEERQAVAEVLYRELSLFVADNLAHMALEERDNNLVLWAHYTDEEIRQIEGALVASLSPELKGLSARWMVPAVHPAQRAELLGGMRSALPTPVFAALLESLRPLLSPPDWRKLKLALAV